MFRFLLNVLFEICCCSWYGRRTVSEMKHKLTLWSIRSQRSLTSLLWLQLPCPYNSVRVYCKKCWKPDYHAFILYIYKTNCCALKMRFSLRKFNLRSVFHMWICTIPAETYKYANTKWKIYSIKFKIQFNPISWDYRIAVTQSNGLKRIFDIHTTQTFTSRLLLILMSLLVAIAIPRHAMRWWNIPK